MVKSESHVTRSRAPAAADSDGGCLAAADRRLANPKYTPKPEAKQEPTTTTPFLLGGSATLGAGVAPRRQDGGQPRCPSNKAVSLSVPHDHRQAAPLLTPASCALNKAEARATLTSLMTMLTLCCRRCLCESALAAPLIAANSGQSAAICDSTVVCSGGGPGAPGNWEFIMARNLGT